MINVLSICNMPEILKILKLVNIVTGIIRVVVPILLIFSLGLTYLNAVISKDQDLISKALKQSVLKAGAAVFVLFVPSLVATWVNIINGDGTYQECLSKATDENISAAYSQRAKELIQRAKDNIQNYTYEQAVSALDDVIDGSEKESLEEELKDIKKVLDVRYLISKATKTKKMEDYEIAAEAISEIEDEAIRKKLESELEKVTVSMNVYSKEYSSPGAVENALGLPYYSQCDSRWKNLQYDIGGGSGGGPATLCSSSCGYTSLSMVVAGLTKNMSVTPVTMVENIRKINISAGQKTSRGYGAASTSELTDNSFLAKYKIVAKTISLGSYNDSYTNIMRALNNNEAIVILVPGHYMTLAKGKKGGVVLLDPFSGGWSDRRRVSGEYSLEYIWNAYNGITWAASYSRVTQR